MFEIVERKRERWRVRESEFILETGDDIYLHGNEVLFLFGDYRIRK